MPPKWHSYDRSGQEQVGKIPPSGYIVSNQVTDSVSTLNATIKMCLIVNCTWRHFGTS